MSAREFFTQERRDALQYNTDDNNGIIDEDYIETLMEAYADQGLKNIINSIETDPVLLTVNEKKIFISILKQ